MTDRVVTQPTHRVAGTRQGVLLLLISCLPVLGSVLLAPNLPAMQKHFADVPGAQALVPVMLTMPALVVGLLSPFVGRVVDRFGRKGPLVGSLVVYSLVGTVPLWVDSLGAIVASRAALGATEAVVQTCATTLIADYYHGHARNRWFGFQTVTSTVGATVFFVVGGALGSLGWRAPFWLYSCGLLFAVLAAIVLFKPCPESAADADSGPLPRMPWRRLLVPIAFSLVGGVVFYTPFVELPYALDALRVASPAVIGGILALASAATAVGAFSFSRLAGRGVSRLLPGAAFLAGIGIGIIGFATNVPLAVVGAVIGSIGAGLLLPTLLTWVIAALPFFQRGRGTGLFNSAFFLGQFASPLVVLALSAAIGGLGYALVAIGVLALIMGGAGLGVRGASTDPNHPPVREL